MEDTKIQLDSEEVRVDLVRYIKHSIILPYNRLITVGGRNGF